VDNTSRTTPFKSLYQTAKQPEKHSPRFPIAMDPPPSATMSTVKNESYSVPNQLSLPPRTVLYGAGDAGELGQGPVDFSQRGTLPKTEPLPLRHPDELRSPKPINSATSTLSKGDMHFRETMDDHNTSRQREQDSTPVPPAVLGRQGTEIYRSTSREPQTVTPSVQETPSRFPVIEDAIQLPNTASRPERQKFTYASVSAPASDPHHGLLSPVQQAIRAVPITQIPSQPRSYDTQTNDLRSREPTDVSAVFSQYTAARSQPCSTAPMPTHMTQGTSSNSMNPSHSSHLDESITAPRTTESFAYPSTSTYPTASYPAASNRSESQPTVLPNSHETHPQKNYSTDISQQTSRPIPSVQYSQSPPLPAIPQPNTLSRTSDAAQRGSVNRNQAYPEPHPSASNAATFSQETTGTHHHNVSLSKATSQSAPISMPQASAMQKSSSGSINPMYPYPPPIPVGSPYHVRPDTQQAMVSTRVPISGHSTTPSRSRPSRQPSRMASDESILMTPSSLAPSLTPKANPSRAPSMPPITRQESKESKDSHKKKNGLFGNLFRSKTPTQKSYEVWHPSISDKQINQSQSSLQSIGKASMLPSGSSTKKSSTSVSQHRGPATIAVDLPLNATGRKEPEKVFSAFKFLHTKRDRTVSHASVEAQDGQTQTAVGFSTNHYIVTDY
jgi:hypothetical protein